MGDKSLVLTNMEKVPVMTTKITLEFTAAQKLDPSNGGKWKEASLIFAYALKTYLPDYLHRIEKDGTNLEDFFEQNRHNAYMESGTSKVMFKLNASGSLDITFNDEPSGFTSLVDATCRKILPIIIAVSTIFRTSKLTVHFTNTEQVTQLREIDLLSCFAEEES